MSKTFLIALSLFLASCGTGQSPNPVNPDQPDQGNTVIDGQNQTKILFVDSQLATCSGVGLTQCMRVRSNASQDWKLFYGNIKGFDYEPGYTYQLQVTESKIANPPADGSSIQTTLVKVLKKEAVASASLANTEWVYQSLSSNGERTAVLPNTHVTLNFSDTRASGDSGCNAYGGEYSQSGNQVSFETLISTKKACLDDATTQQEQRFLTHLSQVSQYSINQDTLTLSDNKGNQLSFQRLETKTLFVDSQLATCTGVGPMQCMRVRSDASQDWTLFYDTIEGFNYEAGYTYELRVSETPVENPPADGSSIKTTLIEVVKKEPVATASLANTEWVYQSLKAEGALKTVLPETELTLNFTDTQASGNAGCNLFSGAYSQNGAQLSFSSLVSTERACLDADATQQEQDFLRHLGQVTQASLNQDLLVLTDSTGAQLNFKAKTTGAN